MSTPVDRDTAAPSRGEWRFVAAMLALTLLIRLGFVYLTSGSGPVFDKYFWLGEKLAKVGWLPKVVFADCPLFIYLVGVLHVGLGLNEPGLRVLQALLSPIVVYLVWSFARPLGGPLAAGVAALVLALSPAVTLYDTQPMPFVWINLANAATLYFLFAWRRGGRLRSAALAGLSLGVSLLLRPNVLPWLLILIVWMIAVGWRERRRAAGAAAVMALVAALTVAPITLINVSSGGDLVLVTASGGLNLFGGNNPQSFPLGCTTFPLVSQVQTYLVGESVAQPITPEHLAYRQVAEWLVGHKLSAKAASAVWEREAVAYARRSPAAFVRGLAAKLRHFFNAYESHDTDSAYARWQKFGKTPPFFFGVVGAAAGIGLIAALRAWRDYLPFLGLALVYAFNCTLFYVSSRLRLPVLLCVAVFAGLGARTLFELYRARRVRQLAAALVAGTAFAAFCVWPTDATIAVDRSLQAYVHHFRPGSEAFLRGDRARGLEELASALALNPQSRNVIADFLQPYGTEPQVAAFVRDRLSAPPPAPVASMEPAEARRWRAVERFLAGDYPGAIADFGAVLELKPYDWDAYYARAVTKIRVGAWAESASDLERAFEYGRKFETGLDELYFAIGRSAANAGDLPKAREFLRRALFVNPGYREARDLADSLASR